jgi:hypothetical protein
MIFPHSRGDHRGFHGPTAKRRSNAVFPVGYAEQYKLDVLLLPFRPSDQFGKLFLVSFHQVETEDLAGPSVMAFTAVTDNRPLASLALFNRAELRENVGGLLVFLDVPLGLCPVCL